MPISMPPSDGDRALFSLRPEMLVSGTSPVAHRPLDGNADDKLIAEALSEAKTRAQTQPIPKAVRRRHVGANLKYQIGIRII